MTEISTASYFAWPPVDLDAAFAALRDERGRSLERRARRAYEQTDVLPRVRVHMSELVPIQATVSLEHVEALLRDPLAVIRLGGRLILHDGHHRAVAQVLQHGLDSFAGAELVDVDALLR